MPISQSSRLTGSTTVAGLSSASSQLDDGITNYRLSRKSLSVAARGKDYDLVGTAAAGRSPTAALFTQMGRLTGWALRRANHRSPFHRPPNVRTRHWKGHGRR